MYIAVIEIPKGSDRRIHHNKDKTAFVDMGPLKERLPINNGVLIVNYGYFKGIMNKDQDDEIDVLLYSKKSYKTGTEIEVEPIATLKRSDGDNKVICIDDTTKNIKCWQDIPKDEFDIIMNFFSHYYPINEILGKKETITYLNENM